MNTEIQNISELTADQLFQNNTSEGILASIKKEALAIVPDITTAKGREAVISQAAMVGKTKVAIEKVGKALADPMTKAVKVINVERKFYKDGFDALRDEVRSPVTEWEREQDAIKQAIQQRIYELEQAGQTTSPNTGDLLPLESLERKLRFLEMEEVTVDKYGDDFNESEVLRAAGINRVTGAITQRKDADELDQLRKDKEARDVAAKAEADKERIAAEAVEKFKSEEAAKADAPAQAPKVETRAKIEANDDKSAERAAKNKAFVSLRKLGISSEESTKIVQAIAAGKIDCVTLNV